MGELAARVLRGERRAIARLITLAESRDPAARPALAAIHPQTGGAHVVGITGPPGSGKSTLVDKLIAQYRAEGRKVGVVAVDPTSPFTGGALLGDRVRMQTRSTDPDVFIRSMGTRGALGGLSRAAHDAIHVLDAAGKDVVLVETVGVGQGEVDVVRAADTVVVVAVPGLGDEIQTTKAGIMEIADVFAVNKADKPESERTAAEIAAWLEIGRGREWDPPVVRTSAEKGDGVPALAEAIARHREHLSRAGRLERRRRDAAMAEILDILRERLLARVGGREGMLEEASRRVAERKEDPATAADRLFQSWSKS